MNTENLREQLQSVYDTNSHLFRVNEILAIWQNSVKVENTEEFEKILKELYPQFAQFFLQQQAIRNSRVTPLPWSEYRES